MAVLFVLIGLAALCWWYLLSVTMGTGMGMSMEMPANMQAATDTRTP